MIENIYTDESTLWKRIKSALGYPEMRDAYYACCYCEADAMYLGPDGVTFCSEGCGCIEGEGGVYRDTETGEVVDL